MSHAMGRRCGEHKAVILDIRCPEGCGSHGWCDEPCSADCPQYDPRTEEPA